MLKQIVICDKEIIYAKRFSDIVASEFSSEYEVRIFSNESLLISSYGSKEINILIVDEDCYKELLELDIHKNITINEYYVLSHDRNNDLYKYQSSKVLINNILLEKNAGSINHEINNHGNIESKSETKTDERSIKLRIKNRVQDRLIMKGSLSDNDTLKIIDECIDTFIRTEDIRLSDYDLSNLRNMIFYSIRGLDILEELISDDSITEIMVNGENNIFYERNGKLIFSGKSFDSREQLLDIIQKIVSLANRTVNMSSPIVDARLQNGSRVNVVLEPVSLDGPTLTIRRFPSEPLTAEKLINSGSVTEEIITFLRKLVYAGYNILISGSTGSGKTTFLNILTSFISKDERIITIEDSAELKIMGIQNLVRLESRNANADSCSEITIRDLIKSALRMRPDRIIVGEVRGAEAIDMIQAFTVGADGSMSTIHSNNAEDALYRLEMLMMMGGVDMPLRAIRRQISMGVDIIIQLGRMKDKTRKLLEIIEITGIDNDVITTNTLYKYTGTQFLKEGDIKNKYKLEKVGFN